jgi:hypothetical protein
MCDTSQDLAIVIAKNRTWDFDPMSRTTRKQGNQDHDGQGKQDQENKGSGGQDQERHTTNNNSNKNSSRGRRTTGKREKVQAHNRVNEQKQANESRARGIADESSRGLEETNDENRGDSKGIREQHHDANF